MYGSHNSLSHESTSTLPIVLSILGIGAAAVFFGMKMGYFGFLSLSYQSADYANVFAASTLVLSVLLLMGQFKHHGY